MDASSRENSVSGYFTNTTNNNKGKALTSCLAEVVSLLKLISIYIYVCIYFYLYSRTRLGYKNSVSGEYSNTTNNKNKRTALTSRPSEVVSVLKPRAIWRLHDIARTNIVWCIGIQGGGGGGAFIAQWTCNNISIG